MQTASPCRPNRAGRRRLGQKLRPMIPSPAFATLLLLALVCKGDGAPPFSLQRTNPAASTSLQATADNIWKLPVNICPYTVVLPPLSNTSSPGHFTVHHVDQLSLGSLHWDVNTTRSCAHGKGWYSVAVTCLACLPPSETSVLALLQLNVTKAGDNDTAMDRHWYTFTPLRPTLTLHLHERFAQWTSEPPGSVDCQMQDNPMIFVDAWVSILMARVLAPHEHALLKAHDVALAWERHKMYWLGFDNVDLVHALVETASTTGPQLLNAAGFCAATAQLYAVDPALQQQYIRWLTRYLKERGVAGLVQTPEYLKWQEQQTQAYSTTSQSSTQGSHTCHAENGNVILPATHDVSNLSAVFHTALSLAYNVGSGVPPAALPSCKLVDASCGGVEAKGSFSHFMKQNCTVHTYLQELPASSVSRLQQLWACMPAALRPIPNGNLLSACDSFVAQLMQQAIRVRGTACTQHSWGTIESSQAEKAKFKGLQLAPRAELMLATQSHKAFPTNLWKGICSETCSLYRFAESPDGGWWEETVQCAHGYPTCTGLQLYGASPASGTSHSSLQPALQHFQLSAKAWVALEQSARTAAEELLSGLTGCKHLSTYRTDMERLYAILWAAYAWQDYQLPLWLLRLMALVLELGLFVQHGFVLPVLLIVMAERTWGTVAWVSNWLRLAFVACTSSTDAITSGCVLRCLFGALRVLGSSIYGFVFRYLLAPSVRSSDWQIDTSSPTKLEASLDALWHHPDKGPLRPANLWWLYNASASQNMHLAICWAAAAWGLRCLGSRAHAALQRLRGPSSPAAGTGSAAQATGVRALAQQQHQQQQQQAGPQRGSTMVLARWAWHLSERQVGRLSAGAAGSLLGRQLSILKRDVMSGESPLTYILLQAACAEFNVHIPGKYPGMYPEIISTVFQVTSLVAVSFTLARCWTACGHIHTYALHSLRCLIQSQREQTRLHLMLWSTVRAQALSQGQGRPRAGQQVKAPHVSQKSGQSQAVETGQQHKDSTQQLRQHPRLQGHHQQQRLAEEASGAPQPAPVHLLLQRCRAFTWAPVAWVLRGSLHLATIAGLGALHAVRVLAAVWSAAWRGCSRAAVLPAAACASLAQKAHRCLQGMGSSIRRSLTSGNGNRAQDISSSGGSTGNREQALTTRISGGGGTQKGQKQAKGGSLFKTPSKSGQDGQQQMQAPHHHRHQDQQDRSSAGSQQRAGVSRSQSLSREVPSVRPLRPSTSGGGRSEAAAGSHSQRSDQSQPGTSTPEVLTPATGSGAGAAQAPPSKIVKDTLYQLLKLPARIFRRASPTAVLQEMGSTAQTGGAPSHGKGRKRHKVSGGGGAAPQSTTPDITSAASGGPASTPAPAPASPTGMHDPDRGLCLICLERLVTHRGFLHANSVHSSFCAECAESIMATPGALCPVCRVPIDSMVIIY